MYQHSFTLCIIPRPVCCRIANKAIGSDAALNSNPLCPHCDYLVQTKHAIWSHDQEIGRDLTYGMLKCADLRRKVCDMHPHESEANLPHSCNTPRVRNAGATHLSPFLVALRCDTCMYTCSRYRSVSPETNRPRRENRHETYMCLLYIQPSYNLLAA